MSQPKLTHSFAALPDPPRGRSTIARAADRAASARSDAVTEALRRVVGTHGEHESTAPHTRDNDGRGSCERHAVSGQTDHPSIDPLGDRRSRCRGQGVGRRGSGVGVTGRGQAGSAGSSRRYSLRQSARRQRSRQACRSRLPSADRLIRPTARSFCGVPARGFGVDGIGVTGWSACGSRTS